MALGPITDPNTAALIPTLRLLGMTAPDVDRVFATFNAATPEFTTARQQAASQQARQQAVGQAADPAADPPTEPAADPAADPPADRGQGPVS